MPAGDEEGICSAHTMSITRKSTTCRDNFSFRTNSLSRRPGRRGALDAHGWWQPRAGRHYSVRAVPFSKVLVSPGPRQPVWSARSWADWSRSALADPVQRAPVPRRLRQRGKREVLAITPGASRAVLVVLAAAGQADHLTIVAGRGVCRGRPQCSVPTDQGQLIWAQLIRASQSDPADLVRPDQAAFARRIRRRRSEARSSSFRPPQVPYFSGREIA